MSARRRHHTSDRLPPFVPLFKDTLASPAWRAMSHGARSLYVALKLRYSGNFKNNGKIYLPQRDAVKELGSGFTQIARWFRELQHYGFIVMTEPGCLGLNGKGKAPHWRLTEVSYMRDPPTRDFMRWDGARFRPGGDRKLKQKPAPEIWSAPLQKSGAPPLQKPGAENGTTAPEIWSIQEPHPAPEIWSITSLPLPAERLLWFTPTITDAGPRLAARSVSGGRAKRAPIAP